MQTDRVRPLDEDIVPTQLLLLHTLYQILYPLQVPDLGDASIPVGIDRTNKVHLLSLFELSGLERLHYFEVLLVLNYTFSYHHHAYYPQLRGEVQFLEVREGELHARGVGIVAVDDQMVVGSDFVLGSVVAGSVILDG